MEQTPPCDKMHQQCLILLETLARHLDETQKGILLDVGPPQDFFIIIWYSKAQKVGNFLTGFDALVKEGRKGDVLHPWLVAPRVPQTLSHRLPLNAFKTASPPLPRILTTKGYELLYVYYTLYNRNLTDQPKTWPEPCSSLDWKVNFS